jgi:hypothetical protein
VDSCSYNKKEIGNENSYYSTTQVLHHTNAKLHTCVRVGKKLQYRENTVAWRNGIIYFRILISSHSLYELVE